MEIAGNPSTMKPVQSKKPSKSSKEPAVKVKYISSPVMVNAKDATEFKAIVQELTGKDSSRGHLRRGSPESGRSGTALVAGEHLLPQLGYGKGQSESFSTVAYQQELEDDFFLQVSEGLSKFEFP